jgi:hypothetical protein
MTETNRTVVCPTRSLTVEFAEGGNVVDIRPGDGKPGSLCITTITGSKYESYEFCNEMQRLMWKARGLSDGQIALVERDEAERRAKLPQHSPPSLATIAEYKAKRRMN